jgi:hypothetical protein
MAVQLQGRLAQAANIVQFAKVFLQLFASSSWMAVWRGHILSGLSWIAASVLLVDRERPAARNF